MKVSCDLFLEKLLLASYCQVEIALAYRVLKKYCLHSKLWYASNNLHPLFGAPKINQQKLPDYLQDCHYISINHQETRVKIIKLPDYL
jgi:hypothetical protein